MNAVIKAPAATRQFLSGNEAVARAVWECGVKVAAAYPGTPASEMLESVARYPDIYAEWSVNEKVSLEVAIGASMTGSRSFCCMKHVGMNVASDALMTLTLTGTPGGMVIAIADDVGMSSSQNEQDSRYWGRFAHLPILEPADSQEAYTMTKRAYALSEQFQCPVILRMTTRVCHVKCLVVGGEREAHQGAGFVKDPTRWVMVPGNAKRRLPMQLQREADLLAVAEQSDLNVLDEGSDRRIGFVTSGPAAMHVREAFPDMPMLKLGMSWPLPVEKVRAFAATVERLVVVEETEPLIETELRAAGLTVLGKEILPRIGELSPAVLRPRIGKLLGEAVVEEVPAAPVRPALEVFPRPPTMCPACPHLGVYFTLSQMKNVIISGDIGCYSLGVGHPWNSLDSLVSMGASMGIALGLDKGRGKSDENKKVLAVIGDSTFMHMGMTGLLDITYHGGNVTVLILDNRTVGMTGGQNTPANGRDIHGNPAPRIDFVKLVEALGVRRERIREVDPYELPTLFKALREETKIEEPSVIITNRPCVLIEDYVKREQLMVEEDRCTGCGTCIEVGCPAILVTRRGKEIKPNGREVDLSFVRIETSACTGCNLCVQTCGQKAIVPAV